VVSRGGIIGITHFELKMNSNTEPHKTVLIERTAFQNPDHYLHFNIYRSFPGITICDLKFNRGRGTLLLSANPG